MGLFKEFKDDLSQAVNELLPDETYDDNQVVNTLENSSDESEPDNDDPEQMTEEAEDNFEDDNVDMDILDAILSQEDDSDNNIVESKPEIKDKIVPELEAVKNPDSINEVTVISKGTTINGSISSDCSLEIMGTIKGDVDCQGKLTIIGNVIGNSIASEIYVGAKRLEGSVNSEGSIKVGLGSVVVGDVTGTSAVIAGAVKGEIDVNGPVIIDSSAVIKGNIKAQSIQINNGAVIEGFCSLSYASVDIDNIFE
jgi:cytoskeletal protein CcmA (bactofilin family)